MGSNQDYMSFDPSVYMSLFPFVWVALFQSKRADHNCAQRMWPQATGSNPLSGSIICPYVRPSSRLWDFFDFCICINFQCVGPALRFVYPHTGVQLRLCVCLSLCLSVSLSIFLSVRFSASHFDDQSALPLIALSACRHMPRGQIASVAVSYDHTYVCPVVCGTFAIFEFLLISSAGVQRGDKFSK